MKRWLALSLFALPLSLVLVAGCNTSPGDGKPCNKDKDSVMCLDPKTRLSCDGEKWHGETCLGPKGCEAGALFVSCDTSLANEGTTCGKNDKFACTLDKKFMMRCKEGKWARTESCLGPAACDASGMFVKCDTSIVAEGDLCENNPEKKTAAAGCSADKKSLYACKDNKWKKVESCTGPDGCTSGYNVRCDGPTVNAGDFCVKEEEADYACATDKKSSLKCEADGWKLSRKCLGPEGCTSTFNSIKCDDSVQEPDAACQGDDAAACSTDGKTVLHCKGGKFVKSRTCPKACKVTYSTIECE
ncbi:MAG: hypothetical protein U0359_01305 [Byssovorax sp.]